MYKVVDIQKQCGEERIEYTCGCIEFFQYSHLEEKVPPQGYIGCPHCEGSVAAVHGHHFTRECSRHKAERN